MDYFERAEPQEEPHNYAWKAQQYFANCPRQLSANERIEISVFAAWLDEGGDKEEQPIPF